MPPKSKVQGKPSKTQPVKRPKPNVSKVTLVAFPQQAQSDFPLRVYDTEGRKKFEALERKNLARDKLAAYDKYLLQIHFPKQRKEYSASQKTPKKTNEKAQAGRSTDAGSLISQKRLRASNSQAPNSLVHEDEDEERSDAVTTSARSGVKVHCDIVCLYMNFKSEMHSHLLSLGAFHLHLLILHLL